MLSCTVNKYFSIVETKVKGCDLKRIDRYREGEVELLHSYYSQKINTSLNTGSIFTKIYLPKSKPFVVHNLSRPPDKIEFVNCIDHKIVRY